MEVPADIAEKLMPGVRKSFRVKGSFDGWKFSGMALLPMGDGNFIIPLNQKVRKAIGKRHGAMLNISLEADRKEPQLNNDFVQCLQDDNDAFNFFQTLARSHQMYFSKWIESARTDVTRTNRIARAIHALSRKMDFGMMLRERKAM